MPTVSWVFEIKHSVGFQRGSPARPGLGDRRVTTPPPLSPVIDLLFIGVAHSPTISPIVFAISTQVGALLIRTPPFHSSTSPCFASRVVLSTRASFSRSLAVIKAFVVSRADRRSSAISTQVGWSSAHQNSAISQQHISVLRIARGSLHACVLLALTRAHQIDRPVHCRTSWPDRLSSA